MTSVLLSLGTNLGDRTENMSAIIKELETILKPPLTHSELMETEPVDVPDIQQWYYNRIVMGEYDGTAFELLASCQEIEIKLGRTKKSTREARTADIDILFFKDYIVRSKNLILPHPEVLHRRFCIEGITSIAPEWVHPKEKKSFYEIYSRMSKDILKQKINFIGI